MSFLSELRRQRDKLKETETVVTSVDGRRFVQRGNEIENVGRSHGFVVDTKPDDTPVMIAPFVYIGSQDCATSSVLVKYKIKHVLSLGIDVDVDGVNHKFVECLDLPETDIRPVLAASLPFVRQAAESGENVLVHCNAGVSRGGAVAVGYLMQYEQLPFGEAYSRVKARRPAVQPNAGFRKQLAAFQPGHLI